jgi:hypothetical protein
MRANPPQNPVLPASLRNAKTARSFGRGFRLLPALAVAGISALLLTCQAAPPREFPEYQLKAAFVYNFAKFISWPSNAFSTGDAPLTIGILGQDPFGPILRDLLAGKTAGQRKLAIKYLKRDDPIEGCHLLFISRSEKDRVLEILGAVDGKSVLTVSEVDNFARQGGIINLLVVGDSIRFEINPEAAEKAGLKISSKLGTLGTVVKTADKG